MDVLKNRFIYLGISIFFLVISMFMFLFTKLNLWIDMTWWINMEYTYENNVNINELLEDLEVQKDLILHRWSRVINNISAYRITWERSIVVVAWFDSTIDERTLDLLKLEFRNASLEAVKSIDSTAEETKYTNIWKSFWDYIRNTAFITLAIAIFAITIYVSWAFSWAVSGISSTTFWLITILTLFHDVIISTWFYVFAWHLFWQFQIDTFFVTALLTILWYSINDTIVIFDRIRSNLKMYAWKSGKQWKNLYEIINLSVNQTIKRSIYTSLTLLFVLFTIFMFWPEAISWFILAMIFGTIIGTYSSIFVASPILYQVNKDKILSVYKKVEVNPDDKLVV